MDGLLGWLTQTIGVGTVAGLANWAAHRAARYYEERITFTAWVRAGISEPTLKLVARNRATEPVFIQEVRISDLDSGRVLFAEGDHGAIFEMIEPGPPFSRTVPRRTWEFALEMPDGLPTRVTLLIIGYSGAPDALETWTIKAMVTNG